MSDYIDKITATDGTTYDIKDTVSGYITSFTDEKLKLAANTSSATFYPVLTTATTTAENKKYDTLFTCVRASSADAHIDIGSNGAAKGSLRLYTTAIGKYGIITPGTLTDIRTYTLPDKTGTIAITDDIPTITLNGTTTTSPSFYAPTSAGTSGQYLKSNGSGAPSWASITIPSITLNGSSTTSPSFYAPTTAGTSGYYLKSNGSGAPTWAQIQAGGVTDVTVGGTSVVTSGVAAIASPVQIVRW